MTGDNCCFLGGLRRRNILDLDIDERQPSGETPIPGTNATVQDIVDSFDRITDRLDMIQFTIEFDQSQSDALADCVASGLCA